MGKKSRTAKTLERRNRQTLFEDIVANDDITVPAGCNQIVRRVFREFDLDILLDTLKRNQGISISELTMCMVTHAMQMKGLSINRLEDILDNSNIREAYGVEEVMDKNDLYRASERLGENMDLVVEKIDTVLRKKFGFSFNEVFFDWSATYIDGEPDDFITFGHSKDHRPDRPQINIGLAMSSKHSINIGLTVVPGKMNDKSHFPMLFKKVKKFLNPGCLIVFDNGAYSEKNGKLVKDSGFDFLTRAQWTPSDDKYITMIGQWDVVRNKDGTVPKMGERDYVRTYRGNSGMTKVLVFSEEKFEADMKSYHKKAERDYDEAMELASSIKKGKPRKKYKNANWFINVKQSYVFNLETMKEREKAIEEAVKSRISGHEGYFILTCSRGIDPAEALRIYRSRNHIEDSYRDLKNGIDIRPLRCRSPEGIKGRVLISFLALFIISFIRFITPEAAKFRAETMIEELNRFSVTGKVTDGKVTDREFSGFTPIIRAIQDAFRTISKWYVPPYACPEGPPDDILRWIAVN